MSRRRKFLLAALAGAAGLILISALSAVLVVRSDWFYNKVRERMVSEIEKATGGDVEIAAFDFDWSSLRAELGNLVVHGAEPEGHPPLFRAESVVVGLKVVSVLRRDIDIEFLAVHKPEVSIEVDAEGNTNFPQPAAARQPESNPVEPFLNLAIERFSVTGGILRYASRTVPFDLSGENLEAHSSYEAAVPGYRGQLKMKQVRIESPETLPVVFDSDLAWTVDADRVQIQHARFQMERSSVELSGTVDNLRAPRASLDVRAELSLEELARPLRLPLLPEGRIDVTGRAILGGDGYSLTASLAANGLALERGRVRVAGISVSAGVEASRNTIRLNDLTVTALNGSFTGEAVIEELRSFRINGQVQDLAIQKLTPSIDARNVVWSGAVSGPVELHGELPGGPAPGIAGGGQFTVAPAPGDYPLEGSVSITFDQRTGAIEFGASHLASGASSVHFSGALRESVRVESTSENLDDFLPALALLREEPAGALPVRLEDGVARFEGVVSGALDDPRVAGHVSLGPFYYQDRLVDRVAANIELSSNRLRIENSVVQQDRARLRGDVEVELVDWTIHDAGALAGEFTLTGASVGRLLKDSGSDLPVDGTLSGAAKLSGTVREPRVLARVHVEAPSAYEETFDQLQAELRYATGSLEVASGRLETGAATLGFRGAYEYPAGDWKSGQAGFDVSGNGVRLGQWRLVREFRAGMDAGLEWRINGTVQFRDAQARLTSLSGDLSIQDLALDDRALGSVHLNANTRGNVLTVRGAARLMDATISANAEWNLQGKSFGLGRVEFAGLTLGALQDVGLFGGPDTEIYMDGVLDGEVGFSGPILEPATWRGMAKVTRFRITPTTARQAEDTPDVTLRNAGPLIFAIDSEGISIQSARLVSDDTDLNASGTLSFRKKNPWNLRLKGSMDLAVLRAFKTDLLADGTSTMDAVVRGSLLQPQVSGRLDFEDASFHLQDLPNGLEKVNGSILFDRNRATIDKFTSQTGGGDLTLAGFIGFGGEELVYRLQAKATRVRVRYPEGVSTLLNAELDFTGTSTRSMLSGEVTVTRAAFNPSTDIGTMLTETMRPSSRPEISNPFLRGMLFDIHVSTAGDAEFLTSLTRDIELEADLRLRGGPAKPIVLGRVAVHQGQIQFFGNKYDILQGEVTFFNPVKIEPVLAMDLETRVRGYTVMINFSGPLDKLNFSYRSDPPLESQEILALLTVGREPEYARSGVGGQGSSGQSFLQAGGDSLLGQALAAPVSSRLQRFFGVSRIKIDPQLTGVDNTPETHITIEQQISREITLTYVTNLAHTQQQIVRVEWNFSRDWSVYAVRDSNGVLGMDFIYRRRFK